MDAQEKNNDHQIDWAFNEDFTQHIHISEAKSGLNGYYCLGCNKEMQAVSQTRDPLLPKLMRGELRVNEFKK